MAANNKMAFPLMHITSGDYTQFAGKFLAGRPYRQPIESMADKGNYASGIEMFFDNSSMEAKSVYSMFLANIIWKNNKLILTPEPETVNSIAPLKLIEAMLGRVIFENMNAASVVTAIQFLIAAAYENPAKNHPILKVKFQSNTKTILQQLNEKTTSDAKVALMIKIGTDFVGPEPFKLVVNPGEYLGEADAFQPADVLPPVANRPAWFKTAAAADRARRLTIIMKDVGKQVINPYYYLHKYAASQNVLTINKAAHPLMQGTPPTYGREAINGQYIFPIGWLNDFHNHPNADPDSLSTVSSDAAQSWKYDDAGKFVSSIEFDIPGDAPEQTKFQALKDAHFANLNNFCSKAQVPLELMFGLLGAETHGKSGAVDTRLEPLKNENIAQINDAALVNRYQKLIGIHCEALHVTKENDDYRFIVSNTEQTPRHNPNVSMEVSVPMKLYYTESKYYTILRETTVNDVPTIGPIAEITAIGGIQGTQPQGKKLFYPYNEKTAGQAASADVEKTLQDYYYLQFNPSVKKVLASKPTLLGDTTVTVLLNGTETELSFMLAKGQQTITDAAVFDKIITVTPGDSISICVATDAGTGDIKDLKVPLLFNKKHQIQINAAHNAGNPFFNEITRTIGGMPAAEALSGGVTKYYSLGSTIAGKATMAEATAFKMPSNGFILIHDLKSVSNALTNTVKVAVLKRSTASDPYKPTEIVANMIQNRSQLPISVPVLKNEEVILEITTQAELPLTKKVTGLTVEFSFIPFDNSQSFFTSRHGYSFDLAALDRSDPTKPISTLNGRNLTWNDLYEKIDRTEGRRISIGPNQFLIATAKESAKAAKHYLDAMGIGPFPEAPRAYIDILSDAAKSLALGAADARFHYNFSPRVKNSETLSTCFDSPLVGTVHNARRGGGNTIKKSGENAWGLVFADADNYIRNSAAMINQAQDHYNETDCKPTVRFKK